MNGFTVSDLKLQYIAGSKIKLIKMPLHFIGDQLDFGSNPEK
jgi:hypothetical protein